MVLCVCPVPVQLRVRSVGGLFQQAGQVEKRAANEIQNFASPRLALTDTQGSLAAALFPLTRDVRAMGILSKISQDIERMM